MAETIRKPDVYPQPGDGWVCYHCGERFTKYGAARDHFGDRPDSDLACLIKAGDERGLVMALRKAEAALEAARRDGMERAAVITELRRSGEQIMRDQHRRERNDDLNTMHGDRVQMCTEIADAIRADMGGDDG